MVIIILMYRQGSGDSEGFSDYAVPQLVIKSLVFWHPVLISSNRHPIQSLTWKKTKSKLLN